MGNGTSVFTANSGRQAFQLFYEDKLRSLHKISFKEGFLMTMLQQIYSACWKKAIVSCLKEMDQLERDQRLHTH